MTRVRGFCSIGLVDTRLPIELEMSSSFRLRAVSSSKELQNGLRSLRCLSEDFAQCSSGSHRKNLKGDRIKRMQNPHFLYPLLAVCILTLIWWFWRQTKLSIVLSVPSRIFPLLSTADRTQLSEDIGASVTDTPVFAGAAAPLRKLASEQEVQTLGSSIPIAPSLAFFSFLFFFAIFLQWLVSKVPVYPPPVSIIWFVFGMAAYGVASIPALLPQQPWEKPGGANMATGTYQAPIQGHNILQTAILEMRFIDSSVVYYVMMPILLYEATQNINWHKFKKFLAGGLTLAVLGVAMQVGLLGVLFYYTFIGSFTQWADHAWTAAFLLAATLSSTDPVAVLSVLNAVNASDKLCTMFDGESLINDGSAVLLFQFFFFLLQGFAETPFSTFIMFVKLLFLGPAFGVAVGFLAYAWLLFFRKHPLTQCLAYITFCYISYFLAEAVFSLSGPLTAVCYGLFIKAYGHIALDREAQSKHHTFVAALALMANCTIFIVSGIVTYGMMSSVFTRDDGVIYWLHLLLTYLYLNGARIVMLVMFLPILRRTGYGLTWKEAVLLVWGGLRGGIVLALGLRIERDGDLDADLTNTLSFFISGSVFLILLINGMTFELLYRLLNPYPPKPFRRVYLEAVMRMIDHQYLEDRKALENHWLFKGTDVLAHADRVVPKLGWRKVDRLGNLDIKCPDITQAFMSLHEAAIYSWVVPSEPFEDPDEDTSSSRANDESSPRPPGESERHGREGSSNGSPAGPCYAHRNGDGVRTDGGLSASTAAAVGGASSLWMHQGSPTQPVAASYGTTANVGLCRTSSDRVGETARDTVCADVEATPSAISSVAEHPCGSPDATLTRERDDGCRKRAEEQERQAHSLAARGQGLKQSGSRRFDPKFNLRLIEHATTAAGEREASVHHDPSEQDSDSRSDGRESVDVLEVTLQGEDPTTHIPLYKLTCRGGGAVGDVPTEKKKDRGMVDKALLTIRKVVAQMHADATPAALKHLSNSSDFRRSRTIGSSHKAQDGQKHLGNSTPLSKSKTGIGMYKPRRTDSSPVEGTGSYHHNSAANVHSPVAFAANVGGQESTSRDTRARRFDTDATIVFNDVCNGTWDEPRRQKRGLFRLRSGRAQPSRRRPSLATPDATGAHAPSAGSRPSSAVSHGGPSADPQSPTSPFELRRASLGPLVSVTEGIPTVGVPVGGRRRSKDAHGGQARTAADALEFTNGAASEDFVGDENGAKMRASFSLASSESYFDLPMSPRPHEGGEAVCSRRKVLRKEREGELYLMIFNACREMYHRLYHKQCIGGSALLSLNTSLDLSNDFAVGKVRQNPIKAWANVLQEDGEEHFPRPKRANLTGFEYEWSVLQSRLHCLQYQRNLYCCFWRNMPSAFLRSLLNSGACQSDLEQLLAFVDVHEELLDKGGRNMELLMGKGLLTNYKQQILSAKRFVLYIRDCYPDSFRFAVCKVAATLLLNLKMKLVKDTASKGLVLEEDKEKLLQILDEQQFRLSRFRPCLILIRPQACLPTAGHVGGLDVSTPVSNSRLQSPRAFSPDHGAQA